MEEILIECTETRDQPKNKERALSRLRTFIYDKEHQKYLDDIVDLGLLSKIKIGKTNYYMNDRLAELFINQADLYK